MSYFIFRYVEKTECPPEEVSSNDPSGKISVTHAAGKDLQTAIICLHTPLS